MEGIDKSFKNEIEDPVTVVTRKAFREACLGTLKIHQGDYLCGFFSPISR